MLYKVVPQHLDISQLAVGFENFIHLRSKWHITMPKWLAAIHFFHLEKQRYKTQRNTPCTIVTALFNSVIYPCRGMRHDIGTVTY